MLQLSRHRYGLLCVRRSAGGFLKRTSRRPPRLSAREEKPRINYRPAESGGFDGHTHAEFRNHREPVVDDVDRTRLRGSLDTFLREEEERKSRLA